MADLTDNEFDQMFAAAEERGRIAHEAEPRAAAARYDPAQDRIVTDLTNGATFAFPPRLAQGLENASAEDLADIEVLPTSDGLHWERLDVDFSVPGLVAGIFGTRRHMARLAG